MRQRPALDVSHLDTSAFGSRDPLWWGVVGLMAIEGTVFVLLLASYFYVRGNYEQWPPSALSDYSRWLATANVGVLLLSTLAIHLSNKSASKSGLRGMRWGLLLATVLGAVFLVLRFLELRALDFRWDSHAYGSVFWLILGLHTAHTIAGCTENLVLLGILMRRPVEEKHLVDVKVSGLYWYFIVASWVATWAILYLDPGVLRS